MLNFYNLIILKVNLPKGDFQEKLNDIKSNNNEKFKNYKKKYMTFRNRFFTTSI